MSDHDRVSLAEAPAGVLAALGPRDAVRWRCHTRVDRYDVPTGLDPATYSVLAVLGGEGQVAALRALGVAPRVVEREGNLLMYGGASCLWQCLVGNGTGTAAQTLTFFNNGNSYIGVGDTNTAAAATQTDLQAASNKLRKAMDSTYPQHTDATTSGAASIVFRSTFGTSDANFAWAEWGVFNGSSGGRLLQRKVESLGTKTSSATWQMSVTLTLA